MLGRLLASPKKLVKRANQLCYFLSHRAEHSEYRRVIRAARAAGVASNEKLLDLKYLGVYLSERMGTEARRQILIHHYTFLTGKVRDAVRARQWLGGVTLWQRSDENIGQTFRIVLEPSMLSPMEGESQLRFSMGDITLCTLTFSFLLGDDIELDHGQILFIGGVQGGVDCRDPIRTAAKSNGEVAPADMLLIGAKAIAEAMGVPFIVGVSSERQAAAGYAGKKIALSYDAMWLQAGSTRTANGFFIVSPCVEERPLEDIAARHRARTRRKRLLKSEIRTQIREHTAAMFGLGEKIA